MSNRRRLCLLAVSTVLLSGTACSSNSTGGAADCGLAPNGFEVHKEVVLDTPVQREFVIDSELRKGYVPASRRDEPGSVLIVDLDNSEIDTVTFDDGMTPWPLALDENSHLLYVGLYESYLGNNPSVAVLDARSGERVRTLEGVGAVSLALDEEGRRLYAIDGDTEKVSVLDPEDGATVATIELPFRPSDLVIDETDRSLYAASTGGESGGTVAVIDLPDGTLKAVVDVKGSDGGLAIAPDGQRLYASSSYYGLVTVLDAESGTTVDTFENFYTPYGMARCGDALFVANRDPGYLAVADAETGEIVQELPVGYHPDAMAIDERTGDLWVLNEGDAAETTPGLLTVVAPKA